MNGERQNRRVRHLRLTDPDLDFWIDVRLTELNGRWLAVADLADTPESGVSIEPRDAVERALAPLGAELARRLATSARIDGMGQPA